MDVLWVGDLSPALQCSRCSQALRRPRRLKCGHVLCEVCVGDSCHVCGGGVEGAVADKSLQKEVQSLPVKCSFEANGCKWRGVLKELDDHTSSCSFRDWVCPNGCGTIVRISEAEHHEVECTRKGRPCELCGQLVTMKGKKLHEKVCTRLPVECPNDCGVKAPREECPLAGFSCPFSAFGCHYSAGRRALQQHISSQPVRHLALLCDGLLSLQTTLSTMQLNMEGMGDSLEKLFGAQLVWRIDHVRQRQNEAKSGARSLVHSPPFMSARHGYKLMLSAALFGDGPVRGQFFSLYISILRGEFDPLLDWPFTHKNPDSSARRPLVFVVRPEATRENAIFVGRPVSERNAAFGTQRLCTLSLLHNYTHDDTIFIKVHVDTQNMTPL